MAVSTTMTNYYTKPSDAIKQAENSKNTGSVGYTDRGTAVVNSSNELGQNSFLNILVAELSNMDPTQDQDSTAYITQMAQFASIEQLSNLNTTMQNFSYQQMVGQVGILSETDSDGNNKFGLITQVYKNGSTTYATIQDATTGEYKSYEISKIIGTSDSGYTSANFETALNSNFLAASELASTGAKAVVLETEDDSSKSTAKKCIIKSAYIDKQNSQVNVTVVLLDDEGNETGEIKTYNYNNIVVAGDLTDDIMDDAVESYNTTKVSSNSQSRDETVNDITVDSSNDTISEIETDNETNIGNSTSESESASLEDSDTDSGANLSTDSTPTVESIEATASYAKEILSNDSRRDVEEENEILSRIAGI